MTISAAKDAKEGTHQITVRGSKGKKATIHVHLKAANPVTGPQTSERHYAHQVPMGRSGEDARPQAPPRQQGNPRRFPTNATVSARLAAEASRPQLNSRGDELISFCCGRWFWGQRRRGGLLNFRTAGSLVCRVG